jgi:hypothetical protein
MIRFPNSHPTLIWIVLLSAIFVCCSGPPEDPGKTVEQLSALLPKLAGPITKEQAVAIAIQCTKNDGWTGYESVEEPDFHDEKWSVTVWAGNYPGGDTTFYITSDGQLVDMFLGR